MEFNTAASQHDERQLMTRFMSNFKDGVLGGREKLDAFIAILFEDDVEG